MAWFNYGDQEKRRYRAGIWLRVRSLPQELLDKIYKKIPKSNTIVYVLVKELQPNDHVLLEIWTCDNPLFGFLGCSATDVYTVCHLSEKENPNWICESDLGRGLVKTKQKENNGN